MQQSLQALLKGVGILLLMAISGAVWFLVSLFVFWQIGVHLHGNSDYYGQYPALFVTAAVVGFFFPLLILRWLKKIGDQRRQTLFRTILIAAVLVLVLALFFWILGHLGMF